MTAATRTRASTPSTCSDGLMPKSTCVRGGRDGPVSQGTWLVSLNAMDGRKFATVPLDLVNAGRAEI